MNEGMNERTNESMKVANFICQKCSGAVSFFSRFLREIELSLQWCAHFADLIVQKCSERDNDFYVKSSSRYSLVHMPTSSSKSAPNLTVFYGFLCQIELSLQSCALFVNNFCRSRPATTETQTYFGDHGSHFT